MIQMSIYNIGFDITILDILHLELCNFLLYTSLKSIAEYILYQ